MRSEDAFRKGSGDPLLPIHGLSGRPEVWRPIIDRLEDSFDLLAVTLAGHAGGAPLPAGVGVSMQAIVDAVERDMDADGLHTAHLVGNSLGGWIALELAARGRARSVIALAPAGGWEQDSPEGRRLKHLFKRNHAISSFMLPHMRTLLSRPRLRGAVLSGVMARGDHPSPAEALTIVEGSVQCQIFFDLMEAIERDGPPSSFQDISCPVLLAWGSKDRILPAKHYAQRMRNLLPNARWMDLPGLGHVPMGDAPQLIAGLIATFVAEAQWDAARKAPLVQAKGVPVTALPALAGF